MNEALPSYVFELISTMCSEIQSLLSFSESLPAQAVTVTGESKAVETKTQRLVSHDFGGTGVRVRQVVLHRDSASWMGWHTCSSFALARMRRSSLKLWRLSQLLQANLLLQKTS